MSNRRKVHQLVKPLELIVTSADGSTVEYRSLPIDVWRVERLTGSPIEEALGTYTGVAAIAWSCSLRANHFARNVKESDLASFERWLTLIENVEIIEEQAEEEAEHPISGDE